MDLVVVLKCHWYRQNWGINHVQSRTKVLCLSVFGRGVNGLLHGMLIQPMVGHCQLSA